MMLLSGLTVVDVTMNYAGPFCTLILNDLGARVIKIEPPDGGDSTRLWMPKVDGDSAAFVSMNRGKESLAVDLRKQQGVDLVRELAGRADVFVQSLRPGVMDAFGLGSDDVRSFNDRLIYCDISAFGSVGPHAGEPGYDAVIQAYSGVMDLTGYPDQEPARVGTGIIDFSTGLWAACGILCGLLGRAQSGKGMSVSATMLGSSLSFLMHHVLSTILTGHAPRRLGAAQHNAAPYEAVHARDGIVMVAAGNDQLWGRLCKAVDGQGLATDPRFETNDRRVANRTALVEELERLVGSWSTEELLYRLRLHSVPASDVRSVERLTDDPQLEAMGLWQPAPDGRRYPVIPLHLDALEVDIRQPPPALGEHSVTVLRELGCGPATIEALLRAGVVHAPAPDPLASRSASEADV